MLKKRLILCLLVVCLLAGLPQSTPAAGKPFKVLVSEDIRALAPVLEAYAAQGGKGMAMEITYEGILDIKGILEAKACDYDAVWLSSAIPLSMLAGGQRVTRSRFTAVTPVVFGVKAGKAKALGWTGELRMADIVGAVKGGELTFVMPSVTQTNSGLSAYLGILSALCGNPNVLTAQHLQSPSLQADLAALFAGVSRSSGSDEYGAELIKTYGYDCIVASEAAIIRLNQELEASGQETLRLLYPVDGVTMADTPFAYIDKGDNQKLEAFLAIQGFLLGAQGQEMLANLGMRTDLGGLIYPEHQHIFREAWGIKHDTYIGTIVYPAKGVIEKALSLYQQEVRKPAHTVFCLDFSGSMAGEGREQLMAAMTYILDPQLSGKDNLQFTAKDQITLVIFSSSTRGILSGTGDQSLALLAKLKAYEATGGTYMHAALLASLDQCKQTDQSQVSTTIVVMTDGVASTDNASTTALDRTYRRGTATVPVYSILFGSASDLQLQPLAELTKGQVFDGRQDLTKTFRQVRGYN